MVQTIHKFKRMLYALAATVPAIGVAASLWTGTTYAGSVTSRSVTMHSSAVSTATQYDVKFTAAGGGNEFVIDFCSNTPLYNDACNFASSSVPTITSGAITAAAGTGNQATGTPSASGFGSGSPVHTIKVTGLTWTAGQVVSINLSGTITNPSAAGTFYGRILTGGSGYAATYTPASTSGNTPTIGSPTDTGGVALSTAATINVTAKVFETLSFCVYKTSCGTSPTVSLGSTTTGALDSTNTYANSDAQYSITSNAANGTNVYMYGQTLCRNGVINFTNCPTGASNQTITAATPGSATAVTKTVGSEQFGMCVDVTGTTNLSAQAPYADTATNCHSITNGTYSGSATFGFDDTNGSNGTNGTNGSLILASTANNPVSGSDSLVFFGNVAATTEYGTYQSNLNLVAVSTY